MTSSKRFWYVGLQSLIHEHAFSSMAFGHCRCRCFQLALLSSWTTRSITVTRHSCRSWFAISSSHASCLRIGLAHLFSRSTHAHQSLGACVCVISPDFNPIETVFANMKNWCRLHANALRAQGQTDMQIVQAAFTAVASTVKQTIVNNEYDLSL